MAQSNNNEGIVLGVLTAVDSNAAVTQRALAHDLGIALGLANTYIKRCVKKGLIKISDAPAKRYAYYLTPQGFAEKTRLTAEFLTQSFRLFRIARQQFGELLSAGSARGQDRVVVVGSGDLADIIVMCAGETKVNVVNVVDANLLRNQSGQNLIEALGCESEPFDLVLIADLSNPQDTFERLASALSPDRLAVPAFLNVSIHSRSARMAP